MGFLENDFTPEAIEIIKKAIENQKTPNMKKFRLELFLLCDKYYKEMPMATMYGVLFDVLMGLHYSEAKLTEQKAEDAIMRKRLNIEESDADKP